MMVFGLISPMGHVGLMLFFITLQDYQKLLSSKHACFLSSPCPVPSLRTPAHTHECLDWLDFALSVKARSEMRGETEAEEELG